MRKPLRPHREGPTIVGGVSKVILTVLYNRVGGKRKFSSYFRFPTSHTTVRAVPHTAVLYFTCNLT